MTMHDTFKKPLTRILVLLAAALLSRPGLADIDSYRLYLAERGDIPWQSLSPEERDALKRHRKNWNNYDTDRQQGMRQGAKRYLDLPADRQREVEKKRREYENLSPEERERLREEYRRRHR